MRGKRRDHAASTLSSSRRLAEVSWPMGNNNDNSINSEGKLLVTRLVESPRSLSARFPAMGKSRRSNCGITFREKAGIESTPIIDGQYLIFL